MSLYPNEIFGGVECCLKFETVLFECRRKFSLLEALERKSFFGSITVQHAPYCRTRKLETTEMNYRVQSFCNLSLFVAFTWWQLFYRFSFRAERAAVNECEVVQQFDVFTCAEYIASIFCAAMSGSRKCTSAQKLRTHQSNTPFEFGIQTSPYWRLQQRHFLLHSSLEMNGNVSTGISKNLR